MQDVALFVMSCDKYSSVWYPYFELIKKYWPNHPDNVYLSSETRGYSCAGIDINVINSNKVEPWSKRLYDALHKIPEEYIIFSLEDFFLLGPVDNTRIQKCLEWMKADRSIAECRLTNYDTVDSGDYYKDTDFRVCPIEHPYRVDTQVALWRKSYLMSIINQMETPWQFEPRASQRSKSFPEKLLWFSPSKNLSLDEMIVPYYNKPDDGYGIAWGKWLYNNRIWFEKNNIYNVRFSELGSLSQNDVERRKKYLYSHPNSLARKVIKSVYKTFVYADRIIRGLKLTGLQDIKNTICILISRRK